MSSVEEIIAKLAEDLRRQKIGQQALNASAKLNLIELLGEEAKIRDTLYADRDKLQNVEYPSLADYRFTHPQPTATFLIDLARVMFSEV